MDIKPSPGCPNPLCLERQREWARRAAELAASAPPPAEEEEEEGPVHESNEWGIEVVGDAGAGAGGGGPAQQQAQQQQQELPEGVEYSMPVERGVDEETLRREAVGATDAGVDDLMAQLAALGGGGK